MIAEAIDAEAIPLTVTRPVGSYNDDGRGEIVMSAPVDIQAAVQPGNLQGEGRMLRDLPEGVRSEVKIVGWTRYEIAADDRFEFSGESYRVVHAYPWRDNGFTAFAAGRVK